MEQATVSCYECGVLNDANKCNKCYRWDDITKGLQNRLVVVHCPECDSYLKPPGSWIKAQLHSEELLNFCINRLNYQNKVIVVNAQFLWTERLSKRIKVKLTVQKEVLNCVLLKQQHFVEYVLQDQMCESCSSKVQHNPDRWVALVQLRQQVSHRKSFFYLEQRILERNLATHAIKIAQLDRGIDFFFAERSHAAVLVDFVTELAPVRSRREDQLVSRHCKSNNFNDQCTFSLEISPIWHEDLIFFPPKVAARFRSVGPLVICTDVNKIITFLDPLTLRHCSLTADEYWRSPFEPLMSSGQLVEYIVLEVKVASSEAIFAAANYVPADILVSDIKKNDRVFSVRTHLGDLLKPGDYALGYDLYGAYGDPFKRDKPKRLKGLELPEVILIRKSSQKNWGKRCTWKLNSHNMEIDHSKGKDLEQKLNSEYRQFLRDLEENTNLRSNISLYPDEEYQPSEIASIIDEEDVPSIPSEELGSSTANRTTGMEQDTVSCNECGALMRPNDEFMCDECVRWEDITQYLPKRLVIVHCLECESYFQPPGSWITAQLDSEELLNFCIERLRNNNLDNKVMLLKAEFHWTEPSSKRIKVVYTVQKVVLDGVVLKQAHPVEFFVQDQMCESCSSRGRAEPDRCVSVVQLRQQVSHWKTFFYLEQFIVHHDSANRAIKIIHSDDGIDFFFAHRSHASELVDLVRMLAPVRIRQGKQLVSCDPKSDNSNDLYRFTVEISPIWHEDLIILPPEVAARFGNIDRLVFCTGLDSAITFFDPLTLKHCWFTADEYWREPFEPLFSSRHLVEYIVLEVKVASSEVKVRGMSYVPADMLVARVSDDVEKNDRKFSIRTHLGHLLKPGDYALGYDLYGASIDPFELDKLKGLELPGVILIKKSYLEKRQKNHGKPRAWKLKSLHVEIDKDLEQKLKSDYELFLRDLEENPNLRFYIPLYSNEEYQPSESISGDEEDVPSVPLKEIIYV